MNSMGLYFNLCRGFRRWQSLRDERSKFLRWLKAGKVDLTIKGISASFTAGWLACTVQSALIAGADEIFFASRLLRGIRVVETHPTFWNFCDVSARDKWVAAGPQQPLTPEDIEYMLHFQGFQRI